MDFTVNKYIELLQQISGKGYSFSTFEQFLRTYPPKSVVLRHDVDAKPENSLHFAKIQYSKGIAGVYYFRAVPTSWDEKIIREIANMGHEIGYHYESMTTCKGNVEQAIRDFEINLIALRRLAPVSTICMHGSPMSRYDSRDMWKHYSYKDFGVIGEPYFDIDFNKVAYLTDTGRRWNGSKVSVRDKVDTSYEYSFKNTCNVIAGILDNQLPDHIMLTFHPQRWNTNPILWMQEAVFQNIKNVVKYYFFVSGKFSHHE